MKEIGVSPVPDATVYSYPVQGKGGVGFTYIQPVTESFIALDCWPETGGAYLIICSCVHFEVKEVAEVLRIFGYEVVDIMSGKVSLAHGTEAD
jgi:S-adenosylmethionine/arginine decarboxylase-like enzyme